MHNDFRPNNDLVFYGLNVSRWARPEANLPNPNGIRHAPTQREAYELSPTASCECSAYGAGGERHHQRMCTKHIGTQPDLTAADMGLTVSGVT